MPARRHGSTGPTSAPLSFFFFNDTATTEIYTLSLHDALPISVPGHRGRVRTQRPGLRRAADGVEDGDRKSTRLNSSHGYISYAVFCLKKKKSEAFGREHADCDG